MAELADSETRRDLHATVKTAQELGPDYESEVLDGFLTRLESRLDSQIAVRVRRELDRQDAGPVPLKKRRQDDTSGALKFHFFSMVLAIPLTAIAAGTTGIRGLVVAWVGLAVVNIAAAAGGSGGHHQRRRSFDED